MMSVMILHEASIVLTRLACCSHYLRLVLLTPPATPTPPALHNPTPVAVLLLLLEVVALAVRFRV